jgi:hypothetical protein
MIRTLLIIAGAGFVLSAACLGGAAALGGRDMAREGWAWTLHDDDGDTVRFERENPAAANEPQETRRVAWTGGESLTVEGSIDVTFVQGAASEVVITGPRSAVERVVVEGGRIRVRDGAERVTFGFRPGGFEAWSDSERLRVVVTAPRVSRFELKGSDDLSIEGYDQDTLAIDVSGSGEVTARGRTRSLTLDLSGSGEADLSSLQTTDAAVDVSGSGEARVAPTGNARIDVSGSGDVTLTTRPAQLSQNLSGSGDVDQL